MNKNICDDNAIPKDVIVINIQPARFTKRLLFLVIVIAILGTLSNWIIYHVADGPEAALSKIFRRFDLGHEPSLPNFYSAVALMVAAFLLQFIARNGVMVWKYEKFYWYALSWIFLFMSLDEALQFHEMLNGLVHMFVQTSGVLFLPWVVFGGFFALVVGLTFIPFLLKLPKRTALLFIAAGTIFISGSIGMELIASLIFDSAGSEELGVYLLSHTFSQAIEETLEMSAIVLFVFSILDYCSNNCSVIKIQITE